jgi:tRNA(Ile)-lysidine synthase
VRRHGGLLLLRAAQTEYHGEATIHWRGEGEIAVPAWGGVLRFEPTDDPGFEAEWLRAEPLQLRGRGGGERFKPHPLRPSKTLKRLFQDAGIAEFERSALPLVWRDGRLIFVAGLGADARLVEAGGERVRLEWQPDAELLPAH